MRTRVHALVSLALLGLLFLGGTEAHADEGEFNAEEYWRQAEEAKQHRGYWHVSLGGGVVIPTDSMSQVYKEGLAAGMRVGYTSAFGLGLTLGAEYTPLPLRSGIDSGESHLVALTANPRFTVGRDLVRVWVGAGGGVAVEKSNASATRSGGTTAELLAAGEAGLELHLFSSGGLALSGNYARSFGDSLEARLFSVLGGLVFTFK